MTNEEFREALIMLAKHTGFWITQIVYIVRMIAQADYDPLPPSGWGDPFEFPTYKLSVFDDPWDFDCINPEVPKPDAQVDLLKAWKECGRDARNIASIYESNDKLSMMQNWKLLLNSWHWARFWSVRHPDPTARTNFA